MEKYIILNTNLRKKAKNDFEKDFFNEQCCILKNNGKYSKQSRHSIGN